MTPNLDNERQAGPHASASVRVTNTVCTSYDGGKPCGEPATHEVFFPANAHTPNRWTPKCENHAKKWDHASVATSFGIKVRRMGGES